MFGELHVTAQYSRRSDANGYLNYTDRSQFLVCDNTVQRRAVGGHRRHGAKRNIRASGGVQVSSHEGIAHDLRIPKKLGTGEPWGVVLGGRPPLYAVDSAHGFFETFMV